MKKITLVLGSLLAFTLLAGCTVKTSIAPAVQGPSTTPTPKPESSIPSTWKTYEGTGFTIKYPDNFYLNITGRGADYISDVKSPETRKILITLLSGLIVSKNESDPQKIANQIAGGTVKDVPYETVTIGGKSAVKVVNQNIENYGILSSKGLVWISAQPVSSTLMPVFEQMIQTVRFQ